MKDYSKVEEAEKLLRESGVKYILVNHSEDEQEFVVNAIVTEKERRYATRAMVCSFAELAKTAGYPEHLVGMRFMEDVCFGVKKAYIASKG